MHANNIGRDGVANSPCLMLLAISVAASLCLPAIARPSLSFCLPLSDSSCLSLSPSLSPPVAKERGPTAVTTTPLCVDARCCCYQGHVFVWELWKEAANISENILETVARSTVPGKNSADFFIPRHYLGCFSWHDTSATSATFI